VPPKKWRERRDKNSGGLSAEQLSQQTDRGNCKGGGGCAQKRQPKATPKQQPQRIPGPAPGPKRPPTVAKGDVSCGDFYTNAEAQPYLLPGDPHKLDRDKDGVACDSLP